MKTRFTVLTFLISLYLNGINAQCWKTIVASGQNSQAIKFDNTVWNCGRNDWGILGDGSTIGKKEFHQIIDNDWKQISSSGYFTIALKNNGTLWAWGFNNQGPLGNGSSQSNFPIQLGMANDWKFICAGHCSSFAIKNNGTLWAWGNNDQGQLGNGTLMSIIYPTQIGVDTNWKLISISAWHTLGLKTDGTLWAWGNNYSGNLGDSTLIDRLMPIKIGNDNNWKTVSAGGNHSLGIKTDGTLWSWGLSLSGQLGNGSFVNNQIIPTQVGIDTDWISVTSGRDHSIALKTNGTIWGCGLNTYGQIGDGTLINKNILTQINGSNWSYISAGYMTTFAIKNDSTLWGWGNNQFGELGLIDTLIRNVPTLIPCNTCESPIKSISINVCDSIIYNNIKYDSSGLYQVNFKNMAGCDSVILLNLTVNKSKSQIVNSSFCEGESYVLPDGNIVSKEGVFICTLNSSVGCDSTFIINLKVYPKYSKKFDIEICSNENYILSNGIAVNKPGIYIESLKTFNGCDSTIIVDISINDSKCYLCNPYAPTAFTPNIDNLNDYYSIRGHFSDYNIRIYDRWGELIFKGTNQDLGWDGKYRNIEAPIGTYFYIFEYRCANSNNLKRITGDFILIR